VNRGNFSQRPGPIGDIVFSALPPPWSNQAPLPCGAWLRSCRPEGHTRWPEGSIPEALQDRKADRPLPQDLADFSSGSVITARTRISEPRWLRVNGFLSAGWASPLHPKSGCC
jgi:hypothetical protein